MHPDLREPRPRAASVCAASFSWWGKIRSLPPPWISNGAPSVASAIAEHSMCQPGRPLAPRRVPRRCPPSASRLPEREVERVLLARGALDALALVHLVDVAVRERAVGGQRADAEVDVALGHVGVVALDQVGDQLDDLLRPSASPAARGRGGRCRAARCRRRSAPSSPPRARADGAPAGARRVVDLVVDVGDVRDERRLVALVREEALEQAEDDERARVADVDAPVDGRPARVDADLAAVARPQLGQLPVFVSCRRIVRMGRAPYPSIPASGAPVDRGDRHRRRALAAPDEAHAARPSSP